MSNTIRLSVRLNMDKEADRRAWEYLQRIPRAEHKSINRAVILAINDHFDRQERILHDSYLETREKEDVFLQQILDTITQGMAAAASITTLGNLLPLLQGGQPTPSASANNNESMDAALDFANSF